MIEFLVGIIVGACTAMTLYALVLVSGEEDEHENRTRK